MAAGWYENSDGAQSESINFSNVPIQIGRSGTNNPSVNIVHVQGGWQTVPN